MRRVAFRSQEPRNEGKGLAIVPRCSRSRPAAAALPEISVGVPVPLGGFASVPQSDAEQDRLEPFGTVSPRDTAMSVTVVPLNLIVDQQAWIVNDTPRYPLVNLTDKDD